ncbi:MAG: hypothetical protein NTX09_10850 [Verrucomicrobia bacterium]|nr:hypothetical protein [Verrucomicrobiota bacterium]
MSIPSANRAHRSMSKVLTQLALLSRSSRDRLPPPASIFWLALHVVLAVAPP